MEVKCPERLLGWLGVAICSSCPQMALALVLVGGRGVAGGVQAGFAAL